MLTELKVEDLQGNTLSLPFRDNSSGYTIQEITGLDPVKATIVSSAFAKLDGAQAQSARMETRNINITIGLEPYFGGLSAGDLRQALYSYFMPKSFVNLKFYDNGVFYASIMGQVETFDAPLFTSEPQGNVSIICFDPNFTTPTDVIVNGATVATLVEQTIVYPGSVETGYIFQLNVNRNMSDLIIHNRRPDNSESTLEFSASLENGDVVKISTVSRDKYATLTRSNVTTSILYAVTPASNWGPLYPGLNYIRASASGTAVPFTITYRAKYGGL